VRFELPPEAEGYRTEVRAFLARYLDAEGFVETFPHRHGMDGSFAVRLVRSTSA